MAVMVTGGLGVIGSLVVRKLVESGQRPVVYEMRVDDTKLVSDIVGRFDLVQGDVNDAQKLTATVHEYSVDRIIHMAAELDPRLVKPPIHLINVNILGTANILEIVRLLKLKRVVYCSTRGVYEDISGEYNYPTYRPVTEDYPKMSAPSSHSLYDATKQFCEHLLYKYHQIYGIDFLALRFGSTFSPGKQARHGPMSIVCQMIENAMQGLPTVIPRGGDERDDFVYTKDIAHALVLAAFVEKTEHRYFHIARGEARSLKDMAQAVKEVFPDAIIEIGPGSDFRGLGIHYSCAYDISRARAELGYEPQFGLSEAVRDYVQMVQRLGLLQG